MKLGWVIFFVGLMITGAVLFGGTYALYNETSISLIRYIGIGLMLVGFIASLIALSQKPKKIEDEEEDEE